MAPRHEEGPKKVFPFGCRHRGKALFGNTGKTQTKTEAILVVPWSASVVQGTITGCHWQDWDRMENSKRNCWNCIPSSSFSSLANGADGGWDVLPGE